MAITLGEVAGCRSHLLARLTDEQIQPLLSKLDMMHYNVDAVLHEREQPIRYIHFSCSAVYSSLITMANGKTVEVGTVGNEGFTPMETLLGATCAIETTVCQVEGMDLRMTLDDFAEAVDGSTPLRCLLERYVRVCLCNDTQSAACNQTHDTEQRFARWLLMTHDRVKDTKFYLTQENFAMMLGVHRLSVSMLVALFQQSGAIQYKVQSWAHEDTGQRPA